MIVARVHILHWAVETPTKQTKPAGAGFKSIDFSLVRAGGWITDESPQFWVNDFDCVDDCSESQGCWGYFGFSDANYSRRNGLFISKSLHQMMMLDSAIGVVASISGMYLSYFLNLPSSSVIVLVAFGFFMLAFLFSPSQGILTHLGSKGGQSQI